MAQRQFLRHHGGHVLALAHGGQPLFGEGAFDDARHRQLGGHELDGLVLHSALIVGHIDLYPGRSLIDPPGAAGRLPKGEQLIACIVQNKCGEGVEVQSGFH